MRLTMISQNVQGLNNSDALNRVRSYYQPLFPSLDILSLQEHKLRGDKIRSLRRSFWPRAGFYYQEASPAYGHDADEPGAGSGGICTWIAPHIKHLVQSSGHSRSGRAQWIRLSSIPGEDLSILNVYAPNSSRERKVLWDELAAVLPQDCRWVLLGDWNVVERASDKSNANGSVLSGGEKISFRQLLASLEVFDTFSDTNIIRFSWDNRRKDDRRSLARFDRFYTFEAPAGDPIKKEYCILSECSHSDHLPVRYSLELKTHEQRPFSWKMNNFFLDDPVVRETFTKIWSSHPGLSFFGKIRRCIRFYKGFCKQQSRCSRAEETRLRAELSQAMEGLQSNPANSTDQQRLADSADALEKLELHKLRGRQLRSRLRWMQVGDTGSKEFYRANRKHSGASHITELEDSHGNICHDRTDLEAICIQYYQDLYAQGS